MGPFAVFLPILSIGVARYNARPLQRMGRLSFPCLLRLQRGAIAARPERSIARALGGNLTLRSCIP